MLVRAPAGYGKSTFAAEWCRSDERPAAWLTLRESDNDVVRLLGRLSQALEGLDPVDPAFQDDLNSSTAPIDARLVPRFLDSLALRRPVQLALDDAHVIEEPGAVAVLGELVNAIPDGSQLVLVTRTDPPVGLARSRAGGDVHELGAHELALDEAETRALFALAGIDLTDEETTELCAVTEGWAAGLSMAASSHSQGDDDGQIARSARRHRGIAAFFREEVLDRQPDDVRQFMLATSMLDRLSGPLCDAVTGREDSAVLLCELAETNLFVIPVDDGSEWFRYHRLFQDLLQAEAQRCSDRRTKDLLNRAAAWHELHGDPAEAFEFARRADDFDRAGRVLLAHWDDYLGSARIDTVIDCLNRCREQDIESDPQLALAAGWIYGHLGDAERANRYLAAAERGDLDVPSADGATSLRAAMLVLRGTLGVGGAARIIEDARSFVASETQARSQLLFEGYRILGEGHLLLGHTTAAIKAFEDALVLTETNHSPHHVHGRAWCLGFVALAYADRGDFARADRDTRMAEELLSGLDLAICRLPMLAARATVAASAGDAAGGAAAIAEARELMPAARALPCLQAEWLLRCAEAAYLLGDGDAGTSLAWDAQIAAGRLDDPGSIPDRLTRLRERIAGVDPLLGLLSPAEKRVLRQLASHRTLQEIAEHLYVSRYTVKTHVASIYAKLAVSTRAEAVAKLGDRLLAQTVDTTQERDA